MKDKEHVKYPDDWTKADLVAYVEEERSLKEKFLTALNKLKEENALLRWQLTCINKLLATMGAFLTGPTP